MKLSAHPRFHVCPTRSLRQLKALSPPFAQSETQPTTAFFSVAGCATGSARLLSAHNWGGLLSLYFGLFLYQVHIVATVAGVSRRFACVELRRIYLLETVWKVAGRVGSRVCRERQAPKRVPFRPVLQARGTT